MRTSIRSIASIALPILFSASTLFAQVEEAWTFRFDGPAETRDELGAMAIDAGGNLYVSGVASTPRLELTTFRLDRDGRVVWSDSVLHESNFYDVSSVTVDVRGLVHITACSYGGVVSVKYSPEGERLWIKSLLGAYVVGRHGERLVDDFGDQYFAAVVEGTGPAVVKRDSEGELVSVVPLPWALTQGFAIDGTG